MEQRIITIVGGTGFVGRYVVKLLANAGYRIRVISRFPDNALHLKTAGDVGQIVLLPGNLTQPESLQGKLNGSYAVINLAGIMFESGSQKFSALHAQGAEKLAQLAKSLHIPRFIQISALGVDKASRSRYAYSKMLGENAVLAAFPEATILRPSVIFGPEDNFFNQFAAMAGLAPMLPLIGGGKSCFQPVYVGDVAEAIEACLARDDVKGQIIELGGPQVFTFKEILEYVLRTIGKDRTLLPIPFPIASMMGSCTQMLPRPLLTRDQVKLLSYDNVVNADAKNLEWLGITPTAVDMVVPSYLKRFRKNPAMAA